jgi:hypothetical protein
VKKVFADGLMSVYLVYIVVVLLRPRSCSGIDGGPFRSVVVFVSVQELSGQSVSSLDQWAESLVKKL